MSPIRVDRRQHKDDLNNYIIRMLKVSDIAMVDLTYARPSVYYEAGFAERQIPVIYTARKDHLSRAQEDDRLRVHFDLEMKKIVDWRSPDDQTFATRLRQRSSYLLRPIIHDRKKDDKAEEARQAFHSISVKNRFGLITKTFASQLKIKRFWLSSLSAVNRVLAWDLAPGIGLVGAKRVGKRFVFCMTLACESITKKQLERTVNGISAHSLLACNQKPEIDKYEEHYYFCSLKKIPEQRLTSAFPSVQPFPEEGCFRITRQERLSSREHSTTIWLVSPLDSIPSIRSHVKVLTAKHNRRKSNNYTQLIESPSSNRTEIYFGRQKT